MANDSRVSQSIPAAIGAGIGWGEIIPIDRMAVIRPRVGAVAPCAVIARRIVLTAWRNIRRHIHAGWKLRIWCGRHRHLCHGERSLANRGKRGRSSRKMNGSERSPKQNCAKDEQRSHGAPHEMGSRSCGKWAIARSREIALLRLIEARGFSAVSAGAKGHQRCNGGGAQRRSASAAEHCPIRQMLDASRADALAFNPRNHDAYYTAFIGRRHTT